MTMCETAEKKMFEEFRKRLIGHFERVGQVKIEKIGEPDSLKRYSEASGISLERLAELDEIVNDELYKLVNGKITPVTMVANCLRYARDINEVAHVIVACTNVTIQANLFSMRVYEMAYVVNSFMERINHIMGQKAWEEDVAVM